MMFTPLSGWGIVIELIQRITYVFLEEDDMQDHNRDGRYLSGWLLCCRGTENSYGDIGNNRRFLEVFETKEYSKLARVSPVYSVV